MFSSRYLKLKKPRDKKLFLFSVSSNFEHLLYSVLILNILYKKNSKLNNNLKLFENLDTSVNPSSSFMNNNSNRFLLEYGGSLVITTNTCAELECLILCVRKEFEKLKFYIAEDKILIVKYNNFEKKNIKFNYLGFTFLFLVNPIKIKSTLLKKNNSLGYIKLQGSYCVFPSRRALKTIKNKLRCCISKLARLSVYHVILDVNLLLIN